MAKTVQDERLVYIVTLTKEGSNPVEVSCRGDYEVSSDDLLVSRSKEISLTAPQKNQLKSFGTNTVLADIKALEE